MMELLASGRDADVFALGDHRILRRLRHGNVSTREVDVMCHVADEGYPVPRVHDVDGPDLVMDRLDGPTMGEAMVDDVDGHAATLAELHDQLHSLQPPAWLGEGGAILHMDLHPLNVIMTEVGPYVIDWSNVRAGEAALDVADTVCVLSAVSADTVPIPGFPAVRDELIAVFTRHVAHDPTPWMSRAATARLRDPNLAEAELEVLRRIGHS